MAYRRGRYCYKSRREGGRVVTEYLGSGDLAQAIADLDYWERKARKLRQERERAAQDRERAIDRDIDAAGDLLRALAQGVLLASGYHQHKGQWRKRRDER